MPFTRLLRKRHRSCHHCWDLLCRRFFLQTPTSLLKVQKQPILRRRIPPTVEHGLRLLLWRHHPCIPEPTPFLFPFSSSFLPLTQKFSQPNFLLPVSLCPYLSGHHFLSSLVRHTPHWQASAVQPHGLPWLWKVFSWIMRIIR